MRSEQNRIKRYSNGEAISGRKQLLYIALEKKNAIALFSVYVGNRVLIAAPSPFH
jgi:hypothetical protein